MLSERTKDILLGAMCDKSSTDEIVAIMDIVPVTAVASQFVGQVAGMTLDVTIDADVAGIAGDVTLVADSITDIDGLILAWNTANPANTLTLSAGDGTQIPTADITLSGGVDAVLAGGNISERSESIIRIMMCDYRGSNELISLIEAGSGSMSERTKDIVRIALCDYRASNELIALF